jgi:hypothetical protein
MNSFLKDLLVHWPIVGRQLTASSGPQIHFAERTITNNAVTIAVSAAVDQTLLTNSDYIQVTGVYDSTSSGFRNGATVGTNSLTVNRKATYKLMAWSSLTSSVSNTNVSFRFAVNGVIVMTRRNRARVGTSGDRVGFAAHGFIPLNDGDTVTVWIASDKAANITIEDAVFSLHEVLAT